MRFYQHNPHYCQLPRSTYINIADHRLVVKDIQEELDAANRQIKAMLDLAHSWYMIDYMTDASLWTFVADTIEQNLLEALTPVPELNTVKS